MILIFLLDSFHIRATYFTVIFADPPGKPGTPEILDWDKDMVQLKWDPPASDGGSPISKYMIEMKPKFGNWEKVYFMHIVSIKIILLILFTVTDYCVCP